MPNKIDRPVTPPVRPQASTERASTAQPPVPARPAPKLPPLDFFDDRPSIGGRRPMAGAIAAIRNERLSDPALGQAIVGSLVTLDATQIRDRPGRQSSDVDWSGGDGNLAMMETNTARNRQLFVPMPFLKAQNNLGEWGNYMHLGPAMLGSDKPGKLPITVQDSNMFVTSFIAYPLELLSDQTKNQFLAGMRQQAVDSVAQYKRGPAYSFWREKDSADGKFRVIGPTNMFGWQLAGLQKLMSNPFVAKVFGPMIQKLDPRIADWLGRVMDPAQNPQGADAFFNIPNDADDTAVAVALQKVHSRRYDPTSSDPARRNAAHFKVDGAALEVINHFRDVDRSQSLGFDDWKGQDSGAALTWLKDENAPTFADPASGVVPSAVNIVDEVVNANVAFALAVNERKDLPVYAGALNLIARCASTQRWITSCSAYYPQRMTFPYSVSRAYRDGGANEPVMREAMKRLLADSLALQKQHGQEHPDQLGAFPGGMDTSTGLSTAMGFVFLLNAGEELAAEIGMTEQYRTALAQAKAFLVRTGETVRLASGPDGKPAQGLRWEEGTFFQGDPQAATQWASSALTTAIVLEGMTKYAMAYDKSAGSVLTEVPLRIVQEAGGGLAVDPGTPLPKP